jgi:hypothetical protein
MNEPDWPVFGATLSLAIVAVAVALFGPHLGDRVKQWFLRPRVDIRMKNEPPYCHLTKYTGGFLVYYFTFCLENIGRSTLRSCEVILEEVWTADENGDYRRVTRFWPTNLMLHGQVREDIIPGRPPFHVAVGHISEPKCQLEHEKPHSLPTEGLGPNRFIFDYAKGQEEHFKIDSLAPGKHRLVLVIVGDNLDPVRRKIELSWSGSWTTDEDHMLKKEVAIVLEEQGNDRRREDSRPNSDTPPTNPLAVGIMFLSFALILFGLPSPSKLTKVTAVVIFMVSMLFMARIVVSVVLGDRWLFASFPSSARLRRGIRTIWSSLWPIGMLAYLLVFVISLGNGTAKVQGWNPLGSLIVVIGAVWFYILLAVFLARAMTKDGSEERHDVTEVTTQEPKPLWQRVVPWLVVGCIGAALIIYGALEARSDSSSGNDRIVRDVSFIFLGAGSLVGAVLGVIPLKRHWRGVIAWLLIVAIALGFVIWGIVLALTHDRSVDYPGVLSGVLLALVGPVIVMAAVFNKRLSRLSPL